MSITAIDLDYGIFAGLHWLLRCAAPNTALFLRISARATEGSICHRANWGFGV